MSNCQYRMPCTVIAALAMASVSIAADPLLFVSSFVTGEQGAIHSYRFDQKTGTLEPVHKHGGTPNPFFSRYLPTRNSFIRFMPSSLAAKMTKMSLPLPSGPTGIWN